MTQVSRKITITTPADAIWQVISDFGATSQYFVGVVSCTVADEGVGARRALTSDDGGATVERMEMPDEATFRQA